MFFDIQLSLYLRFMKGGGSFLSASHAPAMIDLEPRRRGCLFAFLCFSRQRTALEGTPIIQTKPNQQAGQISQTHLLMHSHTCNPEWRIEVEDR